MTVSGGALHLTALCAQTHSVQHAARHANTLLRCMHQLFGGLDSRNVTPIQCLVSAVRGWCPWKCGKKTDPEVWNLAIVAIQSWAGVRRACMIVA
jgi:hypothetical protein